MQLSTVSVTLLEQSGDCKWYTIVQVSKYHLLLPSLQATNVMQELRNAFVKHLGADFVTIAKIKGTSSRLLN
jgi:ABC-type dipeptide/oligopeptide/nickel transport system permease component